MLVTGDFKFNDDMKKAIEDLQLNQESRKLSLLHCDNTCYEKEKYVEESRPLKEVVDKIALKARNAISKTPDVKIVFGNRTCYSEEVWLKVLSEFPQYKVYLDGSHKRALPILYPKIKNVVDSMDEATIWILDEAEKGDPRFEGRKVEIFYLVGKKQGRKGMREIENGTIIVNYIEYGNHCSKQDLDAFVKLVKFDRYGCQPYPDFEIPSIPVLQKFEPNWNDIMS